MRVSFSVLAALAALALPVGAMAQEGVKDWPCKGQTSDPLVAAAYWGGPLPAGIAPGAWENDPAVRALVVFATEPENAPDTGIARLRESLPKLDPDRKAKLALVAAGMVERSNVLRDFILEGVRNYTLQARILRSVLADNDKAIAALPKEESTAATRSNLTRVRRSNFMRMDDAEEEAEFLCTRLEYVEKKLRRLTAAVKSHHDAP
jgi:hypothetical protein